MTDSNLNTDANALDASIDIEFQVQHILAQARLKAAEFLLDFFTSKTDQAKEEASAVRLAIQTVSRPFRPLDTVLRAVTGKAAAPSHGTSTSTSTRRDPGAIAPSVEQIEKAVLKHMSTASRDLNRSARRRLRGR